MCIRTRNDKKLVLWKPLTAEWATKEITGEDDTLWWKDIYVYPDIVEDDPSVFYLVDSAHLRVYWGRAGDRTFERVDPEAEQEMLAQLGFIGGSDE